MRHWLLSLLSCLLAPSVSAQQAIVNLPSADITPKGKHFLMHETQVRQFTGADYWYGTNFYAYGLGANTEFAVTSYNKGFPSTPNSATGVGVKTAPQLFSRRAPNREIKLTLGKMAILNHRGTGLGSFAYSHASFRLPRFNTRITAGGFFGTEQLFKKNTGNLLLGVEHPLSKRWILLAEWFRGRHDFGFFIPGVLYHPTKSQFIVAGFKIPNYIANGAPGLVLEYGLIF